MIPEELRGLLWIDERLQNPALPDFSLRLFGELVRRAWTKGETWITVTALADALQRDRKLVTRHVYTLEQLGMIERRIRSRKGACTTYFIKPLPPARWRIPEGQKAPRTRGKSPHARGANSPTTVYESNKGERDKGKGAAGAAQAPAFEFMDPTRKQTSEAPTDCRQWEFLADPVPDSWIDDADLRVLWFAWIEVRRKHRAPMTAQGIRISLGKLAQWPSCDAAKGMLERAIEGGWRGLYGPDRKGDDGEVDIPAGLR